MRVIVRRVGFWGMMRRFCRGGGFGGNEGEGKEKRGEGRAGGGWMRERAGLAMKGFLREVV